MLDRAYPRRSRRAIALSIATHAAALGLVALSFTGHGRFEGGTSETRMQIATITIEHRAARTRPPAAHRPLATTAVPQKPSQPRREQALHREAPKFVHGEIRNGASGTRDIARVAVHGDLHTPVADAAQTAPPIEAAAVLPAQDAGVASAAPSPSPEPTPSPLAVVARGSGGIPGGFGQNQPATFYQQASAGALRSRLAPHDVVRIRVDESGRATDVQFVRFNGDESARSDLREALLGLRYLPAECDGMRCEGSIELHL